jgi:hypothetical protein
MEVPELVPELVRQSSKAKEEDCTICYLEPQTKGILCATKEHFICQNCFAPYVSNIVEDAGRRFHHQMLLSQLCG